MASNQNIDEFIDKEKLQKLQVRIFTKEQQNATTQKLKYSEMVKDIIKEITREVENDN